MLSYTLLAVDAPAGLAVASIHIKIRTAEEEVCMLRTLFTGMSMLVITAVATAEPTIVPPDVLSKIEDLDPNGLPHAKTPRELELPLPVLDRSARAEPSGVVDCPAEYEPMEGIFIRWGYYNAELTALTVPITTGAIGGKVFIAVDNQSALNSAQATLTSAGADMSRVEFIIYQCNSVWMRDYGPRYIYENDYRTIIDHTYNRPSRVLDNGFPDHIASYWSEPQYDIPLVHGGGNFHLFANNEAFMTDLIVDENPGLSESDIIQYYADYQNVDLTIFPGFPFSIDGTAHIDMWMMPVGDDTVIIGDYNDHPSSTYPAKVITNDAAATMQAMGYTVYRTPGWNSGSNGYNGTHYTYTNAVFMNDMVLIPWFSGYTAENAQALATFQAACPDKTIIQVDCSNIIGAAGAIHCIVMHVPPATQSDVVLAPNTTINASGPVGGPFDNASASYTINNDSDAAISYEVTCDASWIDITNATGSVPAGGSQDFDVSVNSLANSLTAGTYEATLTFSNLSTGEGNTTRPISIEVGAPTLQYEWTMDTDPGWTTEGAWAFGQPTGGGGEYGGPDPTSGFTGSNVYGYNLNGDYPGNLSEQDLTTAAIDCSNLDRVSLRFMRWLGVEQPQYDHAYIRVSTDGTNWSTIWSNGSTIEDTSWQQQEFDISQYADGQSTVYLRWTMGSTDSIWNFCGWNIDDVQIFGVDISVQTPCPWDTTGNGDQPDGSVGTADFFALLQNWGSCPVGDCPWDTTGDNDEPDGAVGVDDFFALLQHWGPCPQ
jgi:agmatine deiminase